jgi:recombination protein RecA
MPPAAHALQAAISASPPAWCALPLGGSAPERLELSEFQGRLSEWRVAGASAAYSQALRLVAQAQRVGEPAAWVTPPEHCFYPPDAEACGIDLAALPVVRVAEPLQRLKAVDFLLRSGAFGLVVLDWGSAAPPGEALLTRLVALCKHHGSALVCLNQHPEGLGGLVSLRLHSTYRAAASGEYLCTTTALKDKRRGPGWRLQEVFHAPDGLR